MDLLRDFSPFFFWNEVRVKLPNPSNSGSYLAVDASGNKSPHSTQKWYMENCYPFAHFAHHNQPQPAKNHMIVKRIEDSIREDLKCTKKKTLLLSKKQVWSCSSPFPNQRCVFSNRGLPNSAVQKRCPSRTPRVAATAAGSELKVMWAAKALTGENLKRALMMRVSGVGCLEDGFPWWIRFQLVNNSHGDGWVVVL